ncbi:MAG: alpha/beta hydrolase [Chloroflexi bacterium]|nr:MAG: alpha/beta hydrolase [Chloroflexota bacterium]
MPRMSVNGVELYYEDSGSGFPVVFCHEFAGDYRAWEPQVRAFGRLYRCITYSQRGFPPSSVPSDPDHYSQDLLIDDLHGLVTQLGVQKAHFVGFSMGGSVVLNFALRYPQLCRGVVVAGTGAGSTDRAWHADLRRHLRRGTDPPAVQAQGSIRLVGVPRAARGPRGRRSGVLHATRDAAPTDDLFARGRAAQAPPADTDRNRRRR